MKVSSFSDDRPSTISKSSTLATIKSPTLATGRLSTHSTRKQSTAGTGKSSILGAKKLFSSGLPKSSTISSKLHVSGSGKSSPKKSKQSLSHPEEAGNSKNIGKCTPDDSSLKNISEKTSSRLSVTIKPHELIEENKTKTSVETEKPKFFHLEQSEATSVESLKSSAISLPVSDIVGDAPSTSFKYSTAAKVIKPWLSSSSKTNISYSKLSVSEQPSSESIPKKEIESQLSVSGKKIVSETVPITDPSATITLVSKKKIKTEPLFGKNREESETDSSQIEETSPPTSASTSSGTSPSTSKGLLCHVCHKTFSSPGKLKQHSFSHTGERPFSCSHCSKSFSSKFKLVRHQQIHTSERSHQCPQCHKSFHRKDHLNNHMQVHLPNKKFKCKKPECGKEYNSLMSYKKHCAIHAAEEGDLNCMICSTMFENKNDLIQHLKVHVGTRSAKSPGEKKFKCESCDRRFLTRKDVKRHLVVHTGNRDFSCSICPQKFGRKDHLVRHVKKSHGVADPAKIEFVDPLNLPGPSTGQHSLSPPEATKRASTLDSVDQGRVVSGLLLSMPDTHALSIIGPSTMAESQQSIPGTSDLPTQTFLPSEFSQEFKMFSENIKEEPYLTASVEELASDSDDISKMLGMYLQSDPMEQDFVHSHY